MEDIEVRRQNVNIKVWRLNLKKSQLFFGVVEALKSGILFLKVD